MFFPVVTYVITENGFYFTGYYGNDAGQEFIYMAFAADPTTIEPSLEDSFNTVLYTGNGGTQSVTGVGFQPDFTWLKARNTTQWHGLYDSIRGASKWITSNDTNAEADTAGTTITSFNTDGFSLGNDSNGYGANTSGNTYVAWNWKAAEIPAINSNGSIPSVVSANPAAGFSIVSYTGTDVNNTIGHGLGIVPDVIIIKDRTVGRNWRVYHSAIGAGKNLKLNTTDAASSDAAIFQSTTPTENVFYVGASGDVNANTDNFIAYCFAEVAGFSKFDSYTGTGSANSVNVGFEPAFVMVKRSVGSPSQWVILDNKRTNAVLYADLSNAEASETRIVLNSTGFQFTGSAFNESGTEWIYMAFANQF